jgi:hypothetical protein
MYVTKANMAAAVANLTKNLEQVSETLAVSFFCCFVYGVSGDILSCRVKIGS